DDQDQVVPQGKEDQGGCDQEKVGAASSRGHQEIQVETGQEGQNGNEEGRVGPKEKARKEKELTPFWLFRLWLFRQHRPLDKFEAEFQQLVDSATIRLTDHEKLFALRNSHRADDRDSRSRGR